MIPVYSSVYIMHSLDQPQVLPGYFPQILQRASAAAELVVGVVLGEGDAAGSDGGHHRPVAAAIHPSPVEAAVHRTAEEGRKEYRLLQRVRIILVNYSQFY